MSQDMDHRTNKHMNSEPMPGTSRSLLELQDNDGFGDDFGRKFFFTNFDFNLMVS